MYGTGAVYLCYIITHMTLFRALLRPLDRWPAMALQSPNEAEGLFTAAKAVIKGSILCVKEFVEMLENMTGSQWNGFWHSWSRQNFAIGGSFMVHLLHITSASNAVRFSVGDEGDLGFDDEDRELRVWITRWRSATRASATGAAGAKGLANLGLLRVETMLGRLLASEANVLS
ncbi:Aldolase-type TIM barrel [Colletotrichum asianum]